MCPIDLAKFYQQHTNSKSLISSSLLGFNKRRILHAHHHHKNAKYITYAYAPTNTHKRTHKQSDWAIGITNEFSLIFLISFYVLSDFMSFLSNFFSLLCTKSRKKNFGLTIEITIHETLDVLHWWIRRTRWKEKETTLSTMTKMIIVTSQKQRKESTGLCFKTKFPIVFFIILFPFLPFSFGSQNRACVSVRISGEGRGLCFNNKSNNT